MKMLITDGGPHPADKWAEVTIDAILDLIDIKTDSVSPEAAEARQIKRDLRPKLFDILNAHHDGVQKHHRGVLDKAKKPQVDQVIDVEPHMDGADAVLSLLASLPQTTVGLHFASEHVRNVVRSIVGQHTADVIDIERKWHKDRLEAAKGV